MIPALLFLEADLFDDSIREPDGDAEGVAASEGVELEDGVSEMLDGDEEGDAG